MEVFFVRLVFLIFCVLPHTCIGAVTQTDDVDPSKLLELTLNELKTSVSDASAKINSYALDMKMTKSVDGNAIEFIDAFVTWDREKKLGASFGFVGIEKDGMFVGNGTEGAIWNDVYFARISLDKDNATDDIYSFNGKWKLIECVRIEDAKKQGKFEELCVHREAERRARIFGIPIWTFLADPSINVVKIDTLRSTKELQVDFELRDKTIDSFYKIGPYNYQLAKSGQIFLDYGSANGINRVKYVSLGSNLTHQIENNDRLQNSYILGNFTETDCDYVSTYTIRPIPVNSKAFFLSSYGFPEPFGLENRNRWGSAKIWAMTGAGLGIIALVLFVFFNRHAKSKT